MHPLIPSRWQVPAVFEQRLGEKPGRQRLMKADGHLLLILHKIPVPGAEERDARIFWRNPQGEWQSSDGGAGIADFKNHISEYDKTADRLDVKLRKESSAENYFSVLNELTPLARAARHLAAVMQEARDACASDRHILLARDEMVEIDRHCDLMLTEAQQGMQFLAAARADEQAKQSERIASAGHRLNLLMAMCLPATACASILSMNDEQNWTNIWKFAAVAGFLGLVVMFWVSRTKGR
jgi:Mg2+ and Co2+ transporter CorA